jgi:anti-sigma regulatory factor (Ser/Thr protein kinase)
MAERARKVGKVAVADRLTSSSQPTSPDVDVTIQSDPANIAAVRRAVEEAAASAGLDERSVAEVGLCVNEALANVMRHAYGGATDRPIWLAAHSQDGGLVVTIRDWGNGVNPASLPPKPFDPLEPGGLGMICLKKMMSQVRYIPQPDGMMLVMKKEKPNPDGGRISERGHE